MSHLLIDNGNLALAFTAYLIGTASPGPSTLAIMGTAMRQGRPQALALAAGVLTGSLFWGCLAVFGLSSLMRVYSWSLVGLKVFGGLYLLWLAWKAARSAAAQTAAFAPVASNGRADVRGAFRKGLAMHVTNPKAVFVWLSIVALALTPGAGESESFSVVAGCGVIGALVFGSYAIAFSTAAARRVYLVVHRWFDATLALVFGYAGVRLLFAGTRVA